MGKIQKGIKTKIMKTVYLDLAPRDQTQLDKALVVAVLINKILAVQIV
jgi:hypothetical protein